MFDRYIGIDYSGAGTPAKRLSGLAVCCAVSNAGFQIVPERAQGSERKTGAAVGCGVAGADFQILHTYVQKAVRWNREELAHWLVDRLKEPIRTLVGIDHGFSFPIDYFDYHQLPEGNWRGFLEDFRHHWRTQKQGITVVGRKNAQEVLKNDGSIDEHRLGDRRWFRLTDRMARASSSVFEFTIRQGNVAYSTHAGLTWLLYICEQLEAAKAAVHFWPFDDRPIPENQSVVVEVYPALWNWRYERAFPPDRGGHQHDAYSTARWMLETDSDGQLGQFFDLHLTQEQRKMAETEGWIFGVLGSGRSEPREEH